MPAPSAMCCQGCQAIAPTKQVLFLQNIGAVIIRFHRRISGQLCRNCVNEHFARMTLITSIIGWWGIVSVVVTPIYLLINLFNYLSCLSLKPNPGTPSTGTGLAWLAFVIALWPFWALCALFVIGILGAAVHKGG